MKLFLISAFAISCTINIYGFDDPPLFGPRSIKGEIINDDIDEASGIASSYKNKGILWTHNDSGGENRIFAVDSTGASRGVYYINGAENRDWEDIAIGPGPIEDVSYIYIADIGDNNSAYSTKHIYRFPEPDVPLDQNNNSKIISNAEEISFQYPDGERDAETLLIDPQTIDLYVVSKRNTKVRLYRLAYPQSTISTLEAELSEKITLPNDPEENTPYNYITSGAISLDGNEIILKSYSHIYYWSRPNNTSVSEAMDVVPQILTYTQEPQGEAICWKNYGDNGYFTISEEKVSAGGITLNFPAQLYYYKRSTPVGVAESEINNIYQLEQNYPNPFNPNTVISYSLPEDGEVSLKIYDNLGKEIAELVNGRQDNGKHNINFDASKLVSGIYFYTLKVDGFAQTKKMIVLR